MNVLKYAQPKSFWQHFEFSSTHTTALVVALLTTLISYQLTALLTDLTLGCKPRRTARVHTFHTLLLSRRSSPLAVLNAILRRDAITRLYFRRHLAADATSLPRQGHAIPRDDGQVKIAAVCLLMLLLATPPIVNVFAVGVTIESEHTVSFSQASFGGLQLGIKANGTVFEKGRMTEECDAFPVEPLPYDVVAAHVSMCKQTIGPANNTVDEREAGIGLLVASEVRFLVQVSMGTRFWERYYTGYLRTGAGDSLLLRADVGREEGGPMVRKGMEKILELCNSNLTLDDSEEYYKGINVVPPHEFVVGRKEVPCLINVDDEFKNVNAVFREVEEFVTVLQTEQMLVKKPTSTGDIGDFYDAKNEAFLKRRTRIVGIGVLGVVAGVALLARLIVGLMVNNDVNDGIERMVKERLGLEYCESLLKGTVGKTVVRYNLQRLDRGIDDDY